MTRLQRETGGAAGLELQVEERAANKHRLKKQKKKKNRKWCRYSKWHVWSFSSSSGVPSRRNVTNPGEQRFSNLQVDVLLNSLQRGPYLGCLDFSFFFTCKPTNKSLQPFILNHSRENSHDNEHSVKIRMWGDETSDAGARRGCSWWLFSWLIHYLFCAERLQSRLKNCFFCLKLKDSLIILIMSDLRSWKQNKINKTKWFKDWCHQSMYRSTNQFIILTLLGFR